MKRKKIEHYSDKEALDFHNSNKSGKIEIISSKPMVTKRDLALAYSPGVAAPVKAISKNPELAYDSGDMIYVEERSPITRASDQTENVKLIIEF